MRGRGTLLGGATIAALACAAVPAQADHHLMVVSELYPGSSGSQGQDAAFIELQMYASGQQSVGGHFVKTYDAAGVEEFSFELSDVANGQNNHTILIGDLSVANADLYALTLGGSIDRNGGAACFVSSEAAFGPIDCVSWGSYAGTPPSPTGAVVPVGAFGIPEGSSLTRRFDIAGCPTFLEAGDDTDDSAGNFNLTTAETPENNLGPIATTPCPNTRFTKKPKKQATKRRAVFKFTATPPASGFECKLDKKPFKPCTSPFRKRVKPGRHKIKVLAEDEVAPARYSWKVVAD